MIKESILERQYRTGKNIVTRWEKRYPGRQDIIDFLIRDDMLSTRAPGRIKFYREYLARPRQQEYAWSTPKPLPIQKELEPL